MKILLKFIALTFISSTLFISCGKEDEKEGCTDVTAINYDNLAKIDDGSCQYLDSTINIWSNGETGFWGNLPTGSFEIQSCFTDTFTTFLNPDSTFTLADTLIDNTVTPPDTTITPADTTITGDTYLLVNSNASGQYELIIRLLNKQNALDFRNGDLIFSAKLHPDAAINDFDLVIHGNDLNSGGTNCGAYLSSDPVSVFTSALDTSSFKEISIPLLDFADRNMQNIDLVFGLRGNNATPNTSLILIDNIRWVGSNN